MNHITQVALLRRVLRLLEQGGTDMAEHAMVNPVSLYTSAARLEREREVLFRGEPQLVALSTDLPTPGSYLIHDGTGVPILILRGATGELRAFVALCRHRGAQIVSGAGRCEGKIRFSCPYHGWTYDDHGRLVGQPCPEGFAELPAEGLGLERLPAAEIDGLIFVRPTPGEVIERHAVLGGAEAELAPFHFEQYQLFAHHETNEKLNWKLVVDTFLEAYHVSALHRRSLAPMISGATAVWDAFERSGRMVAIRHSVAELRNLPEEGWNLLENSVVLYQLFPNTVLIYQIDHLEIVQAYPGDSPDQARVVYRLYTPEPVRDERARRHFQANFDLLLRATAEEDFGIGAAIQRGFHARPTGSVVYGRNEPGLSHFHRMIEASLQANTAEGGRQVRPARSGSAG